ncbi:MAG: hypothetical protein ABIB71_03595 [Candidatus Woesearchaeota archaeon]
MPQKKDLFKCDEATARLHKVLKERGIKPFEGMTTLEILKEIRKD